MMGVGERDVVFIYFVSPVGGGPIKVGSTSRPKARLAGLSGWSFLELEMVAKTEGKRSVEKAIRELCLGHVIRGEWYEPCETLLEIIEHVKTTGFLPESITRRGDEIYAEALAGHRARQARPERVRKCAPLPYRPLSEAALASRRAKRNEWHRQKREAAGKSRKFSFHITAHPTTTAAE